ncbi:MAG: tRNA CCA-pyrophosphorylase [Desulfobacca sp.]|nr:tRNA CCA-pyrophosphorylase [Desulfobacca sp.]
MSETQSKEGPIQIGSYSFTEFVDEVKKFHGFPAPGVILGGIMVDFALHHMPPDSLFNVLSETNKCLPDAVQLLTPCTIGNGWLSIRNFGRFALAFYDKDTGKGIRVVLNPLQIDAWPDIKDWYYKLKAKEEVDADLLLASIQKGGDSLCQFREIQVLPDLLKKRKRGRRIICPQCLEAYPDNGQGLCLACKGESPYV